MWFGTKDYARFIETPLTGAEVSPAAWSASGTLLNGGGYALNSFGSHKEYNFSWRQSSARESAQLMKSFFDGSFGRGKIYFQDPLTLTTNVLPARWADPSITANFEGPSLVPGVDPSTVSAGDPGVLQTPVNSAQYNLNSVSPTTATFVPQYENLFTNPNLVGDGTWAEVRRNLCGNPAGALDTFGWSAGTARVVGAAPFSSTFFRFAAPASGATASFSFPSVVGSTYTLSLFMRNTSTAARVELRDSAGVVAAGSSNVVRPDWQRVSVTGIARQASSFITVRADGAGDIDFVAVLAEQSPTVNPYFDGSSPTGSIDPDMRQRWLGTPNASESVMEIERVRGLASNNCVAGVSTKGGKPAVRLISTGANASFASFPIPPLAHSSGTMLGTVHLDAAISGALSARFAALSAENPLTFTAPDPNTPGSRSKRLSFGPLTNFYQVRWYHGGSRGSGDVWWTDIGLFAGDYSGPAFSGDTGSVTVGNNTLETRWAGTPDNSVSQAGSWVATATPNLSDDNAVFIPIPDGMQLNLGAFHSFTGTAGVFVTPVTRTGPASSITRISPLASGLFNTVITKQPGTIGVYLWIGKLTAVNSSITINALHARLSPVGKPPGGPQQWVGGQGNEGVRFAGPPTYVNHTGVNGGQVSFAATFVESIL